jgi:hypothetical protein
MAKRKAKTQDLENEEPKAHDALMAEADAEFSNPTPPGESTPAASLPLPPPEQQSTSGTPPASGAKQPDSQRSSSWISRFDSWGDHDVGVTLIEDREKGRMTIAFAEKPPERVRSFLKTHPNGVRYDEQAKVWYKHVNRANPKQTRRETEELAFEAANMLRQDKGLPLKESFWLGM